MPDTPEKPESTVVLVRPDGSTVRVKAAEAEKLKTLHLREQTAREEMEAGISRGIEKYYTTPNRKAATLTKGFLSGLTVGLTDLTTTDEDREEARYNPGYRIGGEILGSLASLKIPGPASLLSRGATKAAEATRLGKTGQALVRGGIEGAGYGAGAALTNAELNGDPITAEAIGAGMGWGALFGGGLSAFGGAVEARMEARSARKLAEKEARFTGIAAEEANALERAKASAKVHSVISEGMQEEHASLRYMEDSIYSKIHSSVHDAANELGKFERTAEKVSDLNFQTIKNSQFAIKSQLIENYLMRAANKYYSKAQIELSLAQAAARDGKYEKMVGRLDKYKEHMVSMETALGGPKFFNSEKAVGQANELIGLAKMNLDNSVRAAEELTSMSALRSTLKQFPKTAEEFTKMTPERVEKLTAAIDGLNKLKSAELDAIRESVKGAVSHMSESLGIRLEGTPGTQMQAMWKTLKEGRSKRVLDEMKTAREGNLLWKRTDDAVENYERAKASGDMEKLGRRRTGSRAMDSFLRYQVGKAAAQKFGSPGYILGSGLVTGLVSMKSAILGTIMDHVEKWAPKAARGMQKYGPRVEPLARRIDGNPDDTSGKSRTELMAARSREIAEAAPGIRDTLYKGLEPLVVNHPELAAAMHAQNVARFQFILSKMPKDPGLAYSNMRSLWKPDAVAMEKFSRYYEVFHDPVGVMTRALKTGKITLEAAEGLREMNPELWQTLRVKMLERISDPAVAEKMKYEDQVHVGMLLGINLHSTMNPHFISAQQQMYTERNQPLEMSPRIQPGGGAGRPSGPGPSATAGQKITEH